MSVQLFLLLTHYKVILVHDNIRTAHDMMMSLPFVLGFTPSMWERAMDVVLEKDHCNLKIT
eukprot:2557681-Ditylum_brightwellii.AAC.1